MKQIIYCLVVTFILSACNTKQSKYPNINNAQIFTDLKWGYNYQTIKYILTDKYKLTYSEEQKQLPPMKVYVYNGGRYNDVETKNWTVTFYNDSLIYVHISVFEDSPEEKDRLFNNLCELNNKELIIENDSSNSESQLYFENRWYYLKDGKKLSNILMSKSKMSKSKEFGILMAKAY